LFPVSTPWRQDQNGDSGQEPRIARNIIDFEEEEELDQQIQIVGSISNNGSATKGKTSILSTIVNDQAFDEIQKNHRESNNIKFNPTNRITDLNSKQIQSTMNSTKTPSTNDRTLASSNTRQQSQQLMQQQQTHSKLL
jgi:hypothetical protein